MKPRSRWSGPPGGGQKGERGFALLVSLLALLALSILAAAGAFIARSDGRISRSHAATVRARELARSGLSEYLASGAEGPGARAFLHGRDTAVVAASRILRVDADTSRVLLRLTSRGVRVRRGRPNAERTLSTLVLRNDRRIVPRGALSSGLPARVPPGADVALSGDPACGGGTAPVAGVAVPPGGLTGDPPSVAGDPPVDDSEPGRVLLRRSGVDSATWAALSGGGLARPDAVVPGGPWPSDPAGWPVIFAEAAGLELDAAASGRGTIVAPGDLTVTGRFRWDGLILVGGALRSDGDPARIEGGVLTGLDVHAGGGGDTVAVGGTTAIRYDPCAVASAAARLLGLRVERPGTRHEPGRP